MTTGRTPILARNASRLAPCSARIGLFFRMRILAMIALNGPLGMLANPLRQIRLSAHHALFQRELGAEFKTLLFALVRMRQSTDCDDDRFHFHSGSIEICLI